MNSTLYIFITSLLIPLFLPAMEQEQINVLKKEKIDYKQLSNNLKVLPTGVDNAIAQLLQSDQNDNTIKHSAIALQQVISKKNIPYPYEAGNLVMAHASGLFKCYVFREDSTDNFYIQLPDGDNYKRGYYNEHIKKIKIAEDPELYNTVVYVLHESQDQILRRNHGFSIFDYWGKSFLLNSLNQAYSISLSDDHQKIYKIVSNMHNQKCQLVSSNHKPTFETKITSLTGSNFENFCLKEHANNLYILDEQEIHSIDLVTSDLTTIDIHDSTGFVRFCSKLLFCNNILIAPAIFLNDAKDKDFLGLVYYNVDTKTGACIKDILSVSSLGSIQDYDKLCSVIDLATNDEFTILKVNNWLCFFTFKEGKLEKDTVIYNFNSKIHHIALAPNNKDLHLCVEQPHSFISLENCKDFFISIQKINNYFSQHHHTLEQRTFLNSVATLLSLKGLKSEGLSHKDKIRVTKWRGLLRGWLKKRENTLHLPQEIINLLTVHLSYKMTCFPPKEIA